MKRKELIQILELHDHLTMLIRLVTKSHKSFRLFGLCSNTTKKIMPINMIFGSIVYKPY